MSRDWTGDADVSDSSRAGDNSGDGGSMAPQYFACEQIGAVPRVLLYATSAVSCVELRLAQGAGCAVWDKTRTSGDFCIESATAMKPDCDDADRVSAQQATGMITITHANGVFSVDARIVVEFPQMADWVPKSTVFALEGCTTDAGCDRSRSCLP